MHLLRSKFRKSTPSIPVKDSPRGLRVSVFSKCQFRTQVSNKIMAKPAQPSALGRIRRNSMQNGKENYCDYFNFNPSRIEQAQDLMRLGPLSKRNQKGSQGAAGGKGVKQSRRSVARISPLAKSLEPFLKLRDAFFGGGEARTLVTSPIEKETETGVGVVDHPKPKKYLKLRLLQARKVLPKAKVQLGLDLPDQFLALHEKNLEFRYQAEKTLEVKASSTWDGVDDFQMPKRPSLVSSGLANRHICLLDNVQRLKADI